MPYRWIYWTLLLLTCYACQLTPEDSGFLDPAKKRFLEEIEADTVTLEQRIELIEDYFERQVATTIDSLDLRITLTLGLLHFKRNDFRNFLHVNRILARKSKKASSDYFLAKAYFNQGYYYDELDRKPDSAYYYYKLSNDAYLKIPDSSEIGSNTVNMAILLRATNDFFKAKELLVESLKYLDEEKDKRFVASVYDQLGANHRKLLNLSEAIHYHKKAIATTNSPNDVVSYKNNLGVVYIENEDYEAARALFEKLLSDSLLKKNSRRYARVLHNYTYNQWKSGNSLSVDSFIIAAKIRKEKNDKSGLLSSYTNLAEFYLHGNPEKSKRYLDSLIALAKQIRVPRAETDALTLLMQLQPNRMDIKDRYIFLKDSLYLQELKVKTQFAHMKYLDEQEKLKILTLERETAERRLEIAEQRTQKVIVLSLLGLFIVVGTSLFYYNRQKFKKEKLQEIYNTEKRISQDLHDSLANDVFGLMTSIQNQQGKNPEVLNKLEHIYQETRKIAHDNSAINAGEGFVDELLSLINLYQSNTVTILTKGQNAVSWEKLDQLSCIVLHRCIKELLVNMRKHSNASLASFYFAMEKTKFILTYRDNGIGIIDKKKGIGLQHINSRLNDLGGTLAINSLTKKGVEIKISIPI
nr:tetratricopeptide repeat-containing sensor histidine kinase [Allomuricauda sp.]